jgi:hypothetical protein
MQPVEINLATIDGHPTHEYGGFKLRRGRPFPFRYFLVTPHPVLWCCSTSTAKNQWQKFPSRMSFGLGMSFA